MNIKEKKKQRFEFLKYIYEVTEGSQSAVVDGEAVGTELGMDRNSSANIVQYLIDEFLLAPMGSGLRVIITHSGIIEIEQALENPDESTEHFLPINLINIGTMINSSIQQGSHGSTQFVEIKVKEATPDIKSFLIELKKSIDKLNLSVEAQNEMLADIDTIEIQTNSPKPKSTIIQESLKSIKTILEGVAVEVMAPGFIQKVNLLLSIFSS